MCTVILGWHVFDAVPLLLAANRDERRGRPSSAPERSRAGPIEILAPRDLQAGGTWLGFNAAGTIAAITNRFGHAPDPDRRSRGALVTDALAFSTARGASEALRSIEVTAYNPFHLLIADHDTAELIWHDGDAIHARSLPPGWHVITERSLSKDAPPREEWIRSRIDELGPRAESAEAFAPLLRVHGAEDTLARTCVHLDAFDYGTRSSTLAQMGREPREARLHHAEGPPCTHAYRDLSRDLVALLESRR